MRQGDSCPGAADRPSGGPERVAAPPSFLESGETQPLPFPLTCLRRHEIAQRSIRVTESLLVDALRVLPPPSERRVVLLHLVPQPVQLQSGVPLALSGVAFLAPGQAPVPGEPGRARM